MTEREIAAEDLGPRMLVESSSGERHPCADALIVRPDNDDEENRVGPLDPATAVWRLGPDDMPPAGARISVAGSLLKAAVVAQDRPDCNVVPRAEVRRAAHRYSFDPFQDNSGFKTYHLNPATVSAYEVIEDGATVALGEWMRRAAALGFDEIWLHGVDAEEAENGFDCGLLARARKIAPETRFWISGGGRTAAHVETIAGRPGLVALVVDEAVADRVFEARTPTRPAPPSDEPDPGVRTGT